MSGQHELHTLVCRLPTVLEIRWPYLEKFRDFRIYTYTKESASFADWFFCDTVGIQTLNLLIRSQMLYSVELRCRIFCNCECKGSVLFYSRQGFALFFCQNNIKKSERWQNDTFASSFLGSKRLLRSLGSNGIGVEIHKKSILERLRCHSKIFSIFDTFAHNCQKLIKTI